MGAATSDGQATPGPWQPLSTRLGGGPIDQTWQEGIPVWINGPVRSWLYQQLASNSTRNRLFARIHYDHLAARLSKIVDELDEQSLLDWIDGVLHITADEALSDIYAEELETLLREGHSVWKVKGICTSW
jgi:hypothetical protein